MGCFAACFEHSPHWRLAINNRPPHSPVAELAFQRSGHSPPSASFSQLLQCGGLSQDQQPVLWPELSLSLIYLQPILQELASSRNCLGFLPDWSLVCPTPIDGWNLFFPTTIQDTAWNWLTKGEYWVIIPQKWAARHIMPKIHNPSIFGHTEPQDVWGWKGPLKVTWSSPPAQAGPPRAGCPGWRLDSI